MGTDPSADPGARTEERAIESVARPLQPGVRLSPSFGIGTQAINPSRRSREQADRKQHSIPGDGLPDRCNPGRLVLHFRLNQDNAMS